MRISMPNFRKTSCLNKCAYLLFMELVRSQDEVGYVALVSPSRLSGRLGISRDSFYRSERALVGAGLITVSGDLRNTHAITIVGNDISTCKREKFVNINYRLFTDLMVAKTSENGPDFPKGHEMYMLLDIHTKCVNRARFGSVYSCNAGHLVDSYAALFGVRRRAVQGYLHTLQQFFKIDMDGNSIVFTPREELFAYKRKRGKNVPYNGVGLIERDHTSLGRAACELFWVSFTKDELTEAGRILRLYMDSFRTKADIAYHRLRSIFVSAIRECTAGVRKAARVLHADDVAAAVRRVLFADGARPLYRDVEMEAGRAYFCPPDEAPTSVFH